MKVNPSAPLDIHMTRSMIDHLFFSIDKLILSHGHFQGCLIQYTGGDLDGANVELGESQVLLTEAQNRLRQFVTEIMIATTLGQSNGQS